MHTCVYGSTFFNDATLHTHATPLVADEILSTTGIQESGKNYSRKRLNKNKNYSRTWDDQYLLIPLVLCTCSVARHVFVFNISLYI